MAWHGTSAESRGGESSQGHYRPSGLNLGTGAAMAPVVGAVEVVPAPGHHTGQAETAGGVS